MNTNTRLLLIVGGVVIGLVVLFAIFWPKNNKYSWRENYLTESRQPYGTHLLRGILGNYFSDHKLVTVEDSLHLILPDELDAPLGNYVFVGEGMLLDSLDREALFRFVERGNTVFISSKSIPYELIDGFYDPSCEDYEWSDYFAVTDTTARLNLSHPNLKDTSGFSVTYVSKGKVEEYQWYYLGAWMFCDEEDYTVRLGYFDEEYINFARIDYGKGILLLHSTPLIFSNFHLLDEHNVDYAGRVFSHLIDGPIYWDNYSGISVALARRMNSMAYYDPYKTFSDQGPLQFILSERSLAWAWYLGLSLALLYLVFWAKRKQRIIPVLEPNHNTSLEFISTIGRLYFLQNSHRKLAQQKIRLWLEFIRNRYHLSTKELDTSFVKNLTIRSEIPQASIEMILLYAKNIESSDFMSESTLVEFHEIVDSFYKKCK